MSGLLGIGGGVLKVMGMNRGMKLPMKVTTSTSNFMIGVTAATSSAIYWALGYIQPFIAKKRQVVIMCAEAVPWRCHRYLIADALLVRGIEIRHILSPPRITAASFWPVIATLSNAIIPAFRRMYSMIISL